VNWQTMNSQAVLNDRADMHVDRARRENLKSQPRRRQRFEIPRVSKKRKHFIEWPVDCLLAYQLMADHA